MHILGAIGFAGHHPALRDLALPAGATLNAHGRLCFPQSMVEDIVAGAARGVVLHGRDSAHDLDVSGQRVHYGTGGAATQVLDAGSGHYRNATLRDLHDLARLADRLPNVHWLTRCVQPSDVSDPIEQDLNALYASAAGTTKHLGISVASRASLVEVTALLDLLSGSLGAPGGFRERPFCHLMVNPVTPPLRFGAHTLDLVAAAVHAGLPINAITTSQAGATAPASLAGTLAQCVAESLAALVFVNLCRPGHPFIFSSWPLVTDLRTGWFSGGGAEGALLNGASAQMAAFYDLPCGVAAGMSDAKLPDAQAGFEKGIGTTMAALAGANMVFESSAKLASLLGCSAEAMAIDDEMLGFVQRGVRGIEVSDDTLALELLDDVARSGGHFQSGEQAMALMRTEYYYPTLGDRTQPPEWEYHGAKDMRTRAADFVRTVLEEHRPNTIEAATDKAIRERFRIYL